MSTALLPYQDASRSVDERLEDLLGRMTLAEKVGQMLQLNAQLDLVDIVLDKTAGSILHTSPERLIEAIRLAATTRLGIPLLVADDAIHGHSFWRGATIFPTQLAMACSWDAGPRRACRPRDGRRGRRDRSALDLLARALHHARPALGPRRRDLRRGPLPHRRARLGDGARLPGRRPRRPDGDPRLRQALRGVLRDPGRARRERGRRQPAQAALAGSCRRSSAWPARAAGPS